MVGKILSDVEKAPTNLRGFIRHCHRENIGWLALLMCILSDDEYEVMATFFGGIPYRPKEKRIRSGVKKLDLIRLKEEMQKKEMSIQSLANHIGRSASVISRMYQFGATTCNKSRGFVADCEKALGLKEDTLVFKEEQ